MYYKATCILLFALTGDSENWGRGPRTSILFTASVYRSDILHCFMMQDGRQNICMPLEHTPCAQCRRCRESNPGHEARACNGCWTVDCAGSDLSYCLSHPVAPANRVSTVHARKIVIGAVKENDSAESSL